MEFRKIVMMTLYVRQQKRHRCKNRLLDSAGEGKGTPLQGSCLENPRDRGAWWAAVYGVAQSWTRLERLSSSSYICAVEQPLPQCLQNRFSHRK